MEGAGGEDDFFAVDLGGGCRGLVEDLDAGGGGLVGRVVGIGAPALLSQHNIPLILSNPSVGANLQDHFFTTISLEIAPDQISSDIARNPAIVQALITEYLTTKSGSLSGIPFQLAFTPPVDANGPIPTASLTSLLSTTPTPNPTPPNTHPQYEELTSLLLDPTQSALFYGSNSASCTSTPRPSAPPWARPTPSPTAPRTS